MIPIMSLPKKSHLGGSAVYNAVRWLSQRGLIAEHREKTLPRWRMIKLTGKGKKIAIQLQQIESNL
jgi:DNA-binding MarR family transcriptional regulator